MRIGAFLRTLGFQLALAMSLLIVGVGTLVVWQVDSILREGEYRHFQEHLERSRDQLIQQIATDRELVATGAIVLANQPDMQEAVAAGDAIAILQIATEYYNRTGPALRGTAGLQVYDATGDLLVRAHDPLRGRQVAVPREVREAITQQASLGVIRIDEILGPAIVGISPVLDEDGAIVGLIEALTAIDPAYLRAHEQMLGVNVALIANELMISADDSVELEARHLTASDRELTADGAIATLTLGGVRYLSTLFPVLAFDGRPIGELYLGVEEELLFANVREVRMAALRITVVGTLISLTLATGLAFIAVQPIRALVDAARRIQGNDLDTPVRTNGPTEVTNLAYALDDLRLAVRQTREVMLNVNRDIATRFEQSAESLSDVTQELTAMHRILGALSNDSPEGLAGVTEHLTNLSWLSGALIAVADGQGHLSVSSSFGLLPAAATSLIEVIEAGVGPQQLEDGIAVHDTASTTVTAPLLIHEIGGFAAVPVVEPDGIAGAVAVTSTGVLNLPESRVNLIHAVAREVALTLERTELASAVEESRRIAESVLHEMSDGVVVLDDDGRCIAVNPAAERLLGASRSELVGTYDRDFLPLADDAIQALRRRATNQSASPVALLIGEKHGRQLAFGAGPFGGTEATSGGMMLLIRDLSAEAEAERVKQDFVSMVGHELRTPLTLIRTTVDLLGEGDAGTLNATQERIVEVLRSNTDRLMSLINDLLDMSSIDSGRMEIRPERTDLTEIVTEVVEDARPAAESKEHQILVRAPANATVWADRQRIGQVVGNLIGNAVKYTPPGGTIEVTIEVDEPWAQVSVHDTGIGISPEDQAQLFQRFYRTSAGRRITGGTGLGLAIARSLIELHGGQIWVASDGDSGSTFSFTLPTRPI